MDAFASLDVTLGIQDLLPLSCGLRRKHDGLFACKRGQAYAARGRTYLQCFKLSKCFPHSNVAQYNLRVYTAALVISMGVLAYGTDTAPSQEAMVHLTCF